MVLLKLYTELLSFHKMTKLKYSLRDIVSDVRFLILLKTHSWDFFTVFQVPIFEMVKSVTKWNETPRLSYKISTNKNGRTLKLYHARLK